MPQATVLMGIQATGKSGFYIRRLFKTHVRVNLDMLRTRHRESVLVRACLDAGISFAVDNTNPAKRDRARYLGPAREAGFSCVGYYFRSRLEEALERNAARPEDERVPGPGVRAAFGRLELPSHGEGFDELYYVFLDRHGRHVIEEWQADG